jgi:hypothetical protein
MGAIVLNRILIVGYLIAAAYMIYVRYGDKPILYPYFWRTVYYMLVFGTPFVFLILMYPLTEGFLQIVALLGLVVFWGTFIVFNIFVANLDCISFKQVITSRNFSRTLILLESLMIIIVAITKFIK